ncbi:MAG: ATP-binding cassette domain-containing protein [Frankia sp.]|nr:ATP-binding cassette domain-containing protein [Frankia sp.]
MNTFIALLVSGAVSGAVYSLLAVGLVLQQTALRVFNFAHTAVAFSIALLYYELTTGLGWPVPVGVVVSVLVVAPLLGLAVDAALFRPLRDADDATKIVATVGLLIALPALALFIVETAVDTFGADIPRGDNITYPPGIGPSPKHIWHLTSWLYIDSNQVIVLGSTAVIAAGLWVLLRRSQLGLRIRATVDRRQLAEYRGVDTRATSRWVVLGSFALAGFTGVIGAPFFSLTPDSYTGLVAVGAAAAVLGSLRSMPLAFVGGLVLGVAQSMFSGYADFADSIPGAASAVPYMLLFVGLFYLARDRGRVAGSVAEVRLPPDHFAGLPAWRRYAPWTVAGVALYLFSQFGADAYWLSLTVQGLAYCLIFLSFVLVTGLGGMVSLAQATFVTFAALIFGLCLHNDVPFVLAALVGVAAAAVLGAVVALPALRLGGLALALATLALALVGDTVLFPWKALSNGDYGWSVPRPTLLGLRLEDNHNLAGLLLVLVAAVCAAVGALRRSPSGHSVTAVRSAPAAATSVGISVAQAKLRIFTLSAAVAGLGGIMLATVSRSITHTSIGAMTGLTWLAIVVLFGVRRPAGAVVAGLFLAASPEILSHVTESTRLRDILFGLGAIQLATAPDGIVTAVSGGLARLRRRLSTRAAAAPAPAATDAAAPTAATAAPAAPAAAATAPAAATTAPPAVATVSGDRPGGDQREREGEVEGEGSGAALRLSGVSAGYGAVGVLRAVSLTVQEAAVTVLLGANGAGKSTLCAVIAGGGAPTAGRVYLGGEDITSLPAYRRAARGLAFAPESRGIFPGLTVTENLALALPKGGRDGAADLEAVFDRFPALAARRRLAAGNLSGGEQQLLALAPLLLHPPRVLVADEPCLGLAPRVSAAVLDLFAELRAAGTAVLVVEEKARHVLDLADQVAFLDLGQVVWSRRAADVDHETLAEAYLQGAP